MAKSTITRAFLILDMLGEDRNTISPEDISETLGTTRSTTYRYIKTLCDTGFLMQLSRRAYALGPRIVELERKIQLSDPLLKSSRPLMQAHADNFPDSPLLLCGLWGDRVLCLHQEGSSTDSAGSPIIRRARGIPFPLFKGGASLSILANLPLGRRRALYLQSSKLIAESGLGETWDEFRRKMRILRDQGYVMTVDTFGSDLIGIASPILDSEGFAIGSIARVAPKHRLSEEQAFADDVKAISNEIHKKLFAQTTENELD